MRTCIIAPPVNSMLYVMPIAASMIIPGTMSAAVTPYAHRRILMKSYFAFLNNRNVKCLSVVMFGRRFTHTRKNVRVTNTAVTIDATRPTSSVMAKPWTGSVPTAYSISAVSAVVTFESMIALIACLNPSSTARFTDFPASISSRIRSKIRTFASTAMPIESAKPANPGSVSGEPERGKAAEAIQHVQSERADGEQSGEPVVHTHDDQHEPDGEQRRAHAVANGIAPERWADRSLIDDMQRSRERTGAENECEVVRILQRLAAELDPAV